MTLSASTWRTIVGLGLVVACGGQSAPKVAGGDHPTAIEHEPCEASGHKVERLEVRSGRGPNIQRVLDGGREICRITDLNRDGKPDMFEYFDERGQLRRRESDYDDNGVMNSIELFEGGRLVRRMLDTNNQGRIDTWDFFDPASGARVKRERDANGDGRVDQWWAYEGEKVTIAMDRNGDGVAEPESTIVLGGNGAAAATDAGAPPSDGGAATTSEDAGAAPAAAPTSPEGGPAPALAIPQDAGTPGKPQRGGAKR